MLTTKIQAAFAYAADAHARQCRKGTQIPYLSHLMAVASLVMEAAADGDAAFRGRGGIPGEGALGSRRRHRGLIP